MDNSSQEEMEQLVLQNQANFGTEEVISPEILEEKMVEKALTDPKGTPADIAAAFFQRSAHDLQIQIDNLSLRALKRMIMNVATYPYLDRQYAVKKGSDEFKASYRFNEMVTQKTIMQLQHEMEKAEKAASEGKDKEQHSLTKQGMQINNETKESKGEQNVNE